ncbi:MAG: adenylosuccinate lyase [Candidatus Cloacimonetes bacterium]|nr:adenylosuccinate lyase [Candidatus Cloacimonadota bacterium]
MIKRYSLPDMSKIWELSNKYQCWLDVELAVCKALYEMGLIPEEDYQQIESKADFDEDRITELENITKHDIIAFLNNLQENIGPASRWIHYGLTSSDILDTATSLQLKQAGEMILRDLINLSEILKIKAKEHRNTLCIGRTHGIHAEPTTFGLKFALWFDEMQRNLHRMEHAIIDISVGKISGAVGNYAHLEPEVESKACSFLELKPANITTQVISRDSYAQYMSTLAIIGTTIEKIALEIRHLQRTEVSEVAENFTKGQQGSSAMPHKKNPIVSEQLCGLARILRSNLIAALENNALWHERDISHSSVERIILPDSTILIDYMLNKTADLIENLVVYPEKMLENLEITDGQFFSQSLLLKLIEKGHSREKAYKIIQDLAFKSRESEKSFRETALTESFLKDMFTENDIKEIFSLNRYTEHINYIFNKLGIN